jgi:hypothetical protein
MALEWDNLYSLGTDVAAFMFFHPARLAHRKASPIDWWSNDFAEEVRAGLLVAFTIGSDGTRTMKFVRRPLSASEERALVTSASFRYLVQDGRVYWDNSDALPSDDQLNNAEEDQNGWIELPNGPYRVTVNALDWFSIPDAEREAEADISHYVVRFEPVTSLDEVPVPTALPELIASKSWHRSRQEQSSDGPTAT